MAKLFDSSGVETLGTVNPPFGAPTTTNGTITVDTVTVSEGGKSLKYTWTSAGLGLFAPNPTAAPDGNLDANWQSMWVTLDLYIGSIASSASICTLAFLSGRHTVYLFNSGGWRIGFTLLNSGTSAKVGSETTSAVITTGAWHKVIAQYQKIGTTQAQLILTVDGVTTSTAAQSPGGFVLPSGSVAHRFGSTATCPFCVNMSIGDNFYMDRIYLYQFRSKDMTMPQILPVNQLAIGTGL